MPPSTRYADWSTLFLPIVKCRCSSSTPATTRSPWRTASVASGPSSSLGSETIGSSMPILRLGRDGPSTPVGAHRATAGA